MARKSKIITIDGREITVKEMKNRHIRSLFDIAQDGDTSLNAFVQHVQRVLPWVCDLTLDELDDMAPSETMQVWQVIKEVNADFFATARKAGLTDLIPGMKATLLQALLTDFANSLQGSSVKAIQGPGTTAGASHSRPSKNSTKPAKTASSK